MAIAFDKMAELFPLGSVRAHPNIIIVTVATKTVCICTRAVLSVLFEHVRQSAGAFYNCSNLGKT